MGIFKTKKVDPLYSGHPWDRSIPNRECPPFQKSKYMHSQLFVGLASCLYQKGVSISGCLYFRVS